jgi:hypothetical protein
MKPDLPADSGKPIYAVTMWSDDNWIYVELPVLDSIPYICKFAFTEGGLSKALHVLRTARTKVLPSTVTLSKKPEVGHIAQITHPKIKRPAPKTTEEQRAQAKAVLKKLGLLNK